MYTANGDLNGDGFNGNDPIYIPKNATDPNEIRFVDQGSGSTLITAAAQATAFEKFIQSNDVPERSARQDHGSQQLH